MGPDESKREVVVCPGPAALAVEAADRIIAAAQAAISDHGRFTLVLSGGSTPQYTYELLARPEYLGRLDWSRTWLFFGDERCVAPGDQHSNYHMAAKSLIWPAHIDPKHVQAIRTDIGTAGQCAAEYEARLRRFFGMSGRGGRPAFDLVLLGLGDDGHTASLFPHHRTLDEMQTWVTWSPPGVLPPPIERVTLTFPAINSARQVLFIVSGSGKATIVRQVLEGECDPKKYPATGVQPREGHVTWLLDAAAASLLSCK